MKLRKFYELISRNAVVTLTNSTLDKVFFEGSVKNIPDAYDDCPVEDFCMSDDGDFLFQIRVGK